MKLVSGCFYVYVNIAYHEIPNHQLATSHQPQKTPEQLSAELHVVRRLYIQRTDHLAGTYASLVIIAI